MAEKKLGGRKIIAQNRKARHDYFVEESYEAGIQLFGTEVKSIRAGTANLKDSFCRIANGEIFATGIHISPYEKGNINNRDPLRDKKLLMHKQEINKLFGLAGKEGYTLIPLSLYFWVRVLKLKLAYAKAKDYTINVKTKPNVSQTEILKDILKNADIMNDIVS